MVRPAHAMDSRMKRIFCLGLLALSFLLFNTQKASAQGCSSCPSGMSWGPGGSGWWPNRMHPWECGALCFRMFGGLHQDGPLFNYGPYSGYYPFEPYGPWGSDLSYHGGSNCGCGLFGRGGCGIHGGGRLRGLLSGGLFNGGLRGGAGCGQGVSMLKNVFARLHPFQRCASAGCSSAPACAETATCGTCINER
jgi:hypothetical protein